MDEIRNQNPPMDEIRTLDKMRHPDETRPHPALRGGRRVGPERLEHEPGIRQWTKSAPGIDRWTRSEPGVSFAASMEQGRTLRSAPTASALQPCAAPTRPSPQLSPRPPHRECHRSRRRQPLFRSRSSARDSPTRLSPPLPGRSRPAAAVTVAVTATATITAAATARPQPSRNRPAAVAATDAAAWPRRSTWWWRMNRRPDRPTQPARGPRYGAPAPRHRTAPPHLRGTVARP